jgi:uncharacterized membrane protein
LHTSIRIFTRRLTHLMFLIGCVLVFFLPPIQSADENSHFIRSVMVSEGQLMAQNRGGTWGQDVPTSLVEYVDAHMYMAHQPSSRYSYDRWYADSHASASSTPRELHSYSGQSLSPLYYAPQVLGIWAGRAIYFFSPFEYNWPAALTFARLGNLFAYILVFAWVIRSAPQFAATLTFVALTPMSFSLAASSSYDVTVILSAVAFFGAVMRSAATEGPLRRSEWALLLGVAFLVGHSKIVYAPVLLTLFVLLRRLGVRQFLALCAASGVVAIAGMLFSSGLFGLSDDPSFQSAISAQGAFVLSHLADMPALVAHSIATLSKQLYITMLGDMGWLDANFPLPALVAWSIVGIAAVIGDAGVLARPRDWWCGAPILIAVLLSTFALFLALYVTWTSVTTGIGVPIIDSVQGRYLLPLLPFLLAGCALLLSRLMYKPVLDRGAILRLELTFGGAILVLAVIVVLLRYWVPAP